jgi:hypothetical protein
MQSTSRQSWQEFKGSDSHVKSFNTILSILTTDHGHPLTGQEICTRAGQDGLWKRLREMEREGLVEAKDKRRCTITNKKAITWSVKGYTI